MGKKNDRTLGILDSLEAIGLAEVFGSYKVPAFLERKLKKKKELMRETWEGIEQKLREQINDQMSAMLADLEEINQEKYGGKTLNIDLEGIRTKFDEMMQAVSHVGQEFDELLVPTNQELLDILAERNRDDSAVFKSMADWFDIQAERNRDDRAEKLDSFCSEIQKRALTDLETKIRTAFTAQNKIIIDAIAKRLSEIDSDISKKTKDYQVLRQEMEQKESEAPSQIQHMYVHELCKILLKQISQE